MFCFLPSKATVKKLIFLVTGTGFFYFPLKVPDCILNKVSILSTCSKCWKCCSVLCSGQIMLRKMWQWILDYWTASSISSYFGNLEGCGAALHKEIRESYYQLVLFLVNSVKGFSAINDRYSTLLTCNVRFFFLVFFISFLLICYLMS